MSIKLSAEAMRRGLALLGLMAVVGLLSTAVGVPVPARPEGFYYANEGGESPSAKVQLTIFIDLLCPDSRDAWPVMKEVTSHYNRTDVALRVILFPLPYHHNAFLASQAALGYGSQFPDRFFDFVEKQFALQPRYSNAQTNELTAEKIIASLVADAVGLGANGDEMKEAMSYGGPYDAALRTSWKYACSRGVSGTPVFLVNDVMVDATPEWKLSDWKALIDPLLNANPIGARM